MLSVPTGPAARRNAAALYLIMLTACRPGEALDARWHEFDWLAGAAPLWRLAAGRMKAGKAHTFPLSPQAASMLLDWATKTGANITGGGYVFDFPRKDGRTTNGLSRAIRLIGLDKPEFADPVSGRTATAHGFRTTFSNWAIHNGEWSPDLANAQLGHSKGAVADAYLRDGQEAPRRLMMNAWGAAIARQIEVAGGSLPGAGSMLEGLRATIEAAKRDGKFDGFVYTG